MGGALDGILDAGAVAAQRREAELAPAEPAPRGLASPGRPGPLEQDSVVGARHDLEGPGRPGAFLGQQERLAPADAVTRGRALAAAPATPAANVHTADWIHESFDAADKMNRLLADPRVLRDVEREDCWPGGARATLSRGGCASTSPWT